MGTSEMARKPGAKKFKRYARPGEKDFDQQ